MNENQFEQFVAQMLSGMKSATDWTIETQRREIEDQDRKLAAAEVVLHKALDFITRERQRLRGQSVDQSLRRLHDEVNEKPPLPKHLQTGQLTGAKQKQPF